MNRCARIILVAIFSLPAQACFSQGMYGIEGGLGRATTGKDYTTPTFEGYCLAKLTRSFYIGGTLSYERYSFFYKYDPSASNVTNGSILNIRQKSGYVFLSPTLDFGIGYRKHLHVHTSFGLGLLADGRQLTNKYEQYQTLPPMNVAYDTSLYYTSNNIPAVISQFTLGITERIPTYGYWNIVISEDFSYIPTNLTTLGPNLKTNYYAITIGIMHKYPMAVVDDD